MSSCDQELCPNWAGDSGCPCAVLGIERDALAESARKVLNDDLDDWLDDEYDRERDYWAHSWSGSRD